MENITRTIYGSYLQSCHLMGVPFSMKPNTTLNEKFDIQAHVAPDVTEPPKLRYFAIGNGGHKMTTGQDGMSKPEPLQHEATDAACFKHLPFILREPENDLTVSERANYGLRREEVHNSVRYIAYYLRRIPLSGVTPAMELKTVDEGTTVTTPFEPTSANLNPTPPELNNSGVNTITGNYATVTAKLNLALSTWEIAELLNVANVLWSDDGFAIISEIAMVSGVDRVVQSPSVGNSTINFNDVIAAQVVSHVNAFYALKFANAGTGLILDIGASDPLFSLQ